MRYGLLLAWGEGERPEKLLLTDRLLVLAGALWAVMLAVGIYAA